MNQHDTKTGGHESQADAKTLPTGIGRNDQRRSESHEQQSPSRILSEPSRIDSGMPEIVEDRRLDFDAGRQPPSCTVAGGESVGAAGLQSRRILQTEADQHDAAPQQARRQKMVRVERLIIRNRLVAARTAEHLDQATGIRVTKASPGRLGQRCGKAVR